MEDSKPHINTLPNEVFVQILSPLATRDLLLLATVSHRFHALILRLLHYRLLQAAALKEYKLMLECYHPSSKASEPNILCEYLGTDGLSDRYEGQGSLYENLNTVQKLGILPSVYSRFRLEAAVEEKSSGTRLVPSTDGRSQVSEEPVPGIRSVSLDQYEDFSQLCAVANLVKVMPGSHLLLSTVVIEEGIIRLWRDWLVQQAQSQAVQRMNGVGDEQNRQTTSDNSLLWIDSRKNFGLKLQVREEKRDPNELILSHDEEQSRFQVKIEELHIRTTRLLLTLERSIDEQRSQPRAVIFGAYHPLEYVM